MKLLTIADDHGTGTAILCEHHFKKLHKHIEGASKQGVSIIVETIRKKGCRLCSSERIGYSQWSGTMFKIWKGFKENESDGIVIGETEVQRER